MDSVFLYIESNGIFAILLIVLLISFGKTTVSMWEEKLFRISIILNIIVLVADTFCWIFDGYIMFDTLWINKMVYCVYYIVTAIFIFSWTMYIICKLRARRSKVKKYMPVMALPGALACFLAVVSLWTGWFYEFDMKGNYIRGPLFMLHTAIIWIYLLLVLAYAVRAMLDEEERKMLREGAAIIIAIMFPVVGGVLQTIYYGLNLAWTGSCIAFTIIFISIQNRQMVTDALTSVYNRGRFSRQLQECISRDEEQGNLYLVMIDVNKFKSINDIYGHIAGDRTLVAVARMLSDVCKAEDKSDFLARYGGDEFAIICYRQSEADIEAFVSRLREESKGLQEKSGLDCPITLSIGWAVYDSKIYATAEKFIASADKNMYIDKEKSRQDS